MNYLEFRKKMFDLACFSINQVYAYQSNFDRNNLTRWVKRGLLIKLRQGLYSFPEYLEQPSYALFFANRIYRPSYISLHTALSFYGIIPEAVVQISSVSTLKTYSFINDFGEYSYNTIKEDKFFGYELKALKDGRSFQIASPEKAIVDLLYVYPFYKSEQDFLDLRFDEDFLKTDLSIDKLRDYSSRFATKALDIRINKLIRAYEL